MPSPMFLRSVRNTQKTKGLRGISRDRFVQSVRKEMKRKGIENLQEGILMWFAKFTKHDNTIIPLCQYNL